MLHKIKMFSTVILLLLGLILAIGYPDGGVKNEKKFLSKKKVVISTLSKAGNAKNFFVEGKKVETKTVTKNLSDNSTNHIIKNKTTRIISKVKQKTKRVMPKPVKKKIKLVTPPPPPKEEEEDEGC
jgi:hypothetical protein